MANVKFVTKTPSPEESSYLEEHINNSNIKLTGIPFGGEQAILVYDEQDRLIGGVNGFQWGDGFTVTYLWIDEAWRGQDIGTQLMRNIEQQAVERSCKQIYLDTYDFQAIGFYLKFGYEIIGTLENFPTPYTHYFLKKALTPPSDVTA